MQPAPFAGPKPGSKPGSRAALPPLPTAPVQVAVETVVGGQHTPPAKRSNPFLSSNPFAADASTEAPRKTTLPWPLIIAGVVSVVVLAVLLAKFSG
jgi:hypothetical protein